MVPDLKLRGIPEAIVINKRQWRRSEELQGHGAKKTMVNAGAGLIVRQIKTTITFNDT